MSEWTEVAKTADVPEEGTFPVQFAGQPVCLYKLGGEVYATHDICTHGNANLSEGFIVDGHIECPFHQGMFDIRTGVASAAPCTVAVRTYPVKVEGGVVWLKPA
ncbi:MAG: non-heme iron oxygenase ferredoxin subunit [Burkholderiales bacterium]|nr:non-heme iron oxygenase ferredoxin subunit [Burkholderiales bacterium]